MCVKNNLNIEIIPYNKDVVLVRREDCFQNDILNEGRRIRNIIMSQYFQKYFLKKLSHDVFNKYV